MPGCARPVGYVPRQTHECDAAVLVRRHLAEFLERCEERVGPLPAFVKGEPWGFAGCRDYAEPGIMWSPSNRTSHTRSIRAGASPDDEVGPAAQPRRSALRVSGERRRIEVHGLDSLPDPSLPAPTTRRAPRQAWPAATRRRSMATA
jgi:hypothetical protein